jgi:hypothetical protein
MERGFGVLKVEHYVPCMCMSHAEWSNGDRGKMRGLRMFLTRWDNKVRLRSPICIHLLTSRD